MMVKCKSYPVIKRKVCCDIILIDVNLSVLNVLGMHEFDLIDHIQFLEEHGTNQSVKITSSYQTLLLYSLFSFYLFHDNSSTYILSISTIMIRRICINITMKPCHRRCVAAFMCCSFQKSF